MTLAVERDLRQQINLNPNCETLCNLTIVHLEMVNILVAVRVFAHLWSKHRILVKCDNPAVVHVLTTGRTRDAFLAACARNIWLVSAQNDVELLYRHVPGKDNGVADLLSRWKNTARQKCRVTKQDRGPCVAQC